MKKIIYILFLAVCLSSCTDLSENVYSDILMEDFFSTEKEMISNAGRAYSKLQAYCTEQSLWTLNIMVSDEGATPINANGSWAEERYAQLQKHKYDPANKLVRKGWEFCFDGIASCNEILYETAISNIEFEGKEKIVSEIKILRAFYYFLAVDGWGNIPFSVDYTATEYPEQKDRAFMFSWIEQEVKDNIEKVDIVPTSLNYGRVTQGMAHTLLAKLYMMAEEWIGKPMWAEAERELEAVMDSKHYVIADSYKSNFSVANENSKENIFAIPYSTTYTQSDHNAFVIYMLVLHPANMETFNITATPWDGLICQPDFFALYDQNDSRCSDSFLFGQQYTLEGEEIKDFIINPIFAEETYSMGRGVYDGAKLCKWPYQTDGLLTGDNVSMDNDFALFRYADVVLLWVESLIRQGRTAEAVQNVDFKKIRTRAGLEPYSAGELTLSEILDERGRELAWEGWRRQDLIRFGKYNDAWWAKSATNASTKLFPIPREARASNPNLEQNAGY